MKSLLSVFIVLLLIPAAVPAQEERRSQESDGQGYAFFAPGAVGFNGTGTYHFGTGGEFNIYRGLGMGVEIGYLTPMKNMGSGIGVFSANGLYSFSTDLSSKIVPFVTAGYSLLFRSGYANAFNFGGGAHYWFSDRVGLRFEVRDHVSQAVWEGHSIQGRIGISFR